MNGSYTIECFEKVHAILLNVFKIVVIEKRGVVGFEIKLFEKGTDRFGPCPGIFLFTKGIGERRCQSHFFFQRIILFRDGIHIGCGQSDCYDAGVNDEAHVVYNASHVGHT
jgi:hypothetical protein